MCHGGGLLFGSQTREERHSETLGSRTIEDSTAKHPCAALEDGWRCARPRGRELRFRARPLEPLLRFVLQCRRHGAHHRGSCRSKAEHLLTTRNPCATTLRRRASALAGSVIPRSRAQDWAAGVRRRRSKQRAHEEHYAEKHRFPEARC